MFGGKIRSALISSLYWNWMGRQTEIGITWVVWRLTPWLLHDTHWFFIWFFFWFLVSLLKAYFFLEMTYSAID